MELRSHLEAYAAELAFWMVGVLDQDTPVMERGSLCESVTSSLRVFGILNLLVDGSADSFYHSLIRSALIRKAFLADVQREHYDGFHRALSRSGAVFDAIAARQYNLVADMLAVSPAEWTPAGEYEDDFWLSNFFHYFTARPTDAPALEHILAAYEAALDGRDDASLAVLKALMRGDTSEFDEAFEGFLVQRQSEIEDDMERGEMEGIRTHCERSICVEGLAILNLAQRSGIVVQDEYALCPSIARVGMVEPFDWQHPFGRVSY